MLHTNFDHNGAVFIRTSEDLLSWSPAFTLMTPTPHFWYTYPTLLGQPDAAGMTNGWLYFGRTPQTSRIASDTLMARRAVSFEKLRP
jgi:hypothetical protein